MYIISHYETNSNIIILTAIKMHIDKKFKKKVRLFMK